MKRALGDNRIADLHPLSELPHPIIEKAVQSFGSRSADDKHEGKIRSSDSIPLLEIRQSQWRGGVWIDPETGVCWLVTAGLAKGGHNDRDDFYKIVERADEQGVIQTWLPGEEDYRLLEKEHAYCLRTEWELDIQKKILAALMQIHNGGSEEILIYHPVHKQDLLATVDVEVNLERSSSENDHETIETDDILVEFFLENQRDIDLFYALSLRVLTSLNPRSSDWVSYGTIYQNGSETHSDMGEPGQWAERIEVLRGLVAIGELSQTEENTQAHYAHESDLTVSMIGGKAVRSLCGKYFVPMQDHTTLEKCPTCADIYGSLPQG